jgi:hypothetical protein
VRRTGRLAGLGIALLLVSVWCSVRCGVPVTPPRPR